MGVQFDEAIRSFASLSCLIGADPIAEGFHTTQVLAENDIRY